MMLTVKVVMAMNMASLWAPSGVQACTFSQPEQREREREDSKRGKKSRECVFGGRPMIIMKSGTVFVRKTEGGRVQGRAVVSRFIGQGCGGCREAQMGRTLPLRNRNAQARALAHKDTRSMFALVPRGRRAFGDRCAHER